MGRMWVEVRRMNGSCDGGLHGGGRTWWIYGSGHANSHCSRITSATPGRPLQALAVMRHAPPSPNPHTRRSRSGDYARETAHWRPRPADNGELRVLPSSSHFRGRAYWGCSGRPGLFRAPHKCTTFGHRAEIPRAPRARTRRSSGRDHAPTIRCLPSSLDLCTTSRTVLADMTIQATPS